MVGFPVPGKDEELLFVDGAGNVARIASGKRQAGEYTAVVLVLVYLPKEREVLLFNRGSGASDMRDHCALTAGKMNATDCVEPAPEVLGRPLSLPTRRRAAAREFKEELGISAETNRFKKVLDFHMPEKGLYFCMLAWPIDAGQLKNFAPDGGEVNEMRRCSLPEFLTNKHLGDAIRYKKADIVAFLEREFAVERIQS
jgi:8-oxo-dGTP pyrophosphatase MutT (NUDIX family)